ncbi:toxin-antitoxin system YwqK family antitoxin [Flavobacterium qiangtangense]|uniref:Toxin-antitoxin system YwqK family antitoxin n=1 Tax=Flavobacterium qiangtangense TaxID=1442595 RepID=A0ABW1PPT7_9FLAO
MNIKLLLVTSLWMPFVFAQTINILPNGVEKERIDYYPNGKISERTVQDLDGNAISIENYFEDGKVKSRYYYKKSYENITISYYENGNQKSQCIRRIICPDGEYNDYYPDGKLKIKRIYDEGKRVGKWLEYSQNGVVTSQTDYSQITSVDDNRDAVYFHSNGNVGRQTSYLNSQPHGKSTTYWPNGNILSIQHYYKGEEDGVWISYSSSGAVVKSTLKVSKSRVNDENISDKTKLKNSLIDMLILSDGRKLTDRIVELTVDLDEPLIVFKGGLMNYIGIELSFDINGVTGTENYFFDIKSFKQINLLDEIAPEKLQEFKKYLLFRQRDQLIKYKREYQKTKDWATVSDDWEKLYKNTSLTDDDFIISDLSVMKLSLSFERPLSSAMRKDLWLYAKVDLYADTLNDYLKAKNVLYNIYLK